MVLQKLERAMYAVVNGISAASSYSKTKGLDNGTKGVNRVIVKAFHGSSRAPQPGNFLCRGIVEVESNPSSVTEEAHETVVTAVQEAFMDTGIAATLSGHVSGFTCLHVSGNVEARASVTGQKLCSEIEFEALCCNSDIA